jgi:hypothetical protein
MADFHDLADHLSYQFKNVPNVQREDCENWVRMAIRRHGVKGNTAENIPESEEYLVMLLSEAIGARRIALDTGHYFRYQDGDEVVDKTLVSEQWLRIANSFELDYRRQKSMTGGGTKFKVARRLDRDV